MLGDLLTGCPVAILPTLDPSSSSQVMYITSIGAATMSRMGRFAKLMAPQSLTRSLYRSSLSNFSASPAILASVNSSSPHLSPSRIQSCDSWPATSNDNLPPSPTPHVLAMHSQRMYGVVKPKIGVRSEQGGIGRSSVSLNSQTDCRQFSAQESITCSSMFAQSQRFKRQHSNMRHPWLLESDYRGFASSVRDVAVASPAPGGHASLPLAATPSGAEGSASGEPGVVGKVAESTEKARDSLVNVASGAWEASKEAAAQMFPSVDNWMDPSGGGIGDLLVPASTAIGVSLAAWLVLPRILRILHSYVESGPTARLLGRLPQEKQPYELSLFNALEAPARLLATTVTFSYLGYIVAPTSIGAHYLTQIWSGATVLTVIWFLHRWKSNVFARLISGRTVAGADRERYLTMDRLSSIGLLLLGGMAFAEACGVAVQSILTVGGIGGVATAFAARDILGNVLSGVAIQFSKPFSVGDAISAGSVSGQVVEMGMHSTQLLNSDKFPITVPNTYFSNQVIVNKSRAQWRGLSLNLPVHIQDLEKLPIITHEIRTMLKSYPKVYLEKEKPRCNVSEVGPSSINIAITCNLKPMGSDDFLMAGEELLLEAARIVTKTGATLGGPAV